MRPSPFLRRPGVPPLHAVHPKDSDQYNFVNFVDVTRYTAIPTWRVFGTSRSGRIAAGNPIASRMSRRRKEITS